MGLVQVIIDDSTSKVITGTYEFDRDTGGTFIGSSGTAFPGTPEAGEWFWRTDESKLYRRDDTNTDWEAVASDVVAHVSTHENGGTDELDVSGLSGVLADDQPALAHSLGGAKHTADTLASLNAKISDATLDDAGDPRTPSAHASGHQNGGADEVNVAGLSGVLADDQPAQAHSLGGAKHLADTLANLNSKISDADLVVQKAISVYDAAGGQNFTGATVLNLDTVFYQDTDTFSLASDEVEVLVAGVYSIHVQVSLGLASGSTRTQGGVGLQVDVGAGFVIVPGTYAYTYNRTDGYDRTTASITVVAALSAGNKVRVLMSRVGTGGTLQTEASGSRLTMRRIQ